MKRLLPVVCLFALIPATGVFGDNFKASDRSVSASKEFVIYCSDLAMRLAVSSFSEQTKKGILGLLGQDDHWKIPVVITFLREDPAQPDRPASEVRLLSVDGGYKIEVNVSLGRDLAKANFQQQLVRAILLEMEYRDQPPGREGRTYIDPPPWLVEGVTAYLHNRDSEVDVDVYKALLNSSHIPPVAEFLSQNTSGMSATSMKLYRACAASLLQLVVGLPNGHACLAAYVHDLPFGHNAPTADFMSHFPALGGSTESLEKWWTLSMARISASDRYKGLSLQETDQKLTALLKITIPTGKTGETKTFAIGEFKQFIKLPQARAVLTGTVFGLAGLQAQSNPLFRPILVEYQTIVADLQRGKTRRIADRLNNVARYRDLVLTRMDQIDDYMNWFEATQMATRSDSFDEYMRTANELSLESPKRDDAINRYLDAVELQMQ
jgi:hypothetical protein